MKTTYTVRVRNPNSWSPDTGAHEILRSCGHKHRTVMGAVKCMRSLVDSNYKGGSWSCNADWYHARIESSDDNMYSDSLNEQVRRCADELFY